MNAPNEINKRALFIITAFSLLVAAACLIINYSVNRSINWSLYPLGALVLIWATVFPLFIMQKNKALGSFAGLAITLVPFLFLIQYLAGVKGWFMPLALPIAALSLLALGVSLMAFTYIKANLFYPVAVTLFLFGVVVNVGIGRIVNNFLSENNINDVSRVSTMSVSAIVSLILIVMGYMKGNKTGTQNGVVHQ